MAEENKKRPLVYAVDFDGTLCDSMFPEILGPKMEMIEYVKNLRQQGNKVILWTCRCGDHLEAAVQWCKEQGLEFDAVNEYLPEQKGIFEDEARKIWADYYIDDKNLYIKHLEPRRTWNEPDGSFGLKSGLDWSKVPRELYLEIFKLLDYEKTGLTPHQIVDMDILYADMARELAEYKKAEAQGWIPMEEPPEAGKAVLLSFANFKTPLVGRYEEDEAGGAYYIGDEDEPCNSYDIFVNGWRHLPECCKD